MTKQKQTKELALVNFTQSWRLKALGFNLPCRYYYNEQGELYSDPDSGAGNMHCNTTVGEYSAPEVELAVLYIRDILGLDCYVQISCWDNSRAKWYGVLPFADEGGIADKKTDTYDKFSQASSAMLDKALASMEGRSDLSNSDF